MKKGIWNTIIIIHNTAKILCIDIKKCITYNSIRREACFSSGLTLKSDMLINRVIDRWRTTLKSDMLTSLSGRWQTTLKLASKREYVTQWCYYSLFKFMGEQ